MISTQQHLYASIDPLRLPDRQVTVFMDTTPREAIGLRVGHLFVRAAFADELADDGLNTISIAHRWLVWHAFGGVTCVQSFATALLIADEISRFAVDLETMTADQGIEAALGYELTRWLTYAEVCDRENKPVVDYRAWLHARKGAA